MTNRAQHDLDIAIVPNRDIVLVNLLTRWLSVCLPKVPTECIVCVLFYFFDNCGPSTTFTGRFGSRHGSNHVEMIAENPSETKSTNQILRNKETTPAHFPSSPPLQ